MNAAHADRCHANAQSPIHYSNVMLADPVTGKPVRTQWRFLEDGTKAPARPPPNTATAALGHSQVSPTELLPAAHMHHQLAAVVWCALQVRVTKGKLASGSIVPRPEILRLRRTPKPLQGAPCLRCIQACLVLFPVHDLDAALLSKST